MSDKFFVDTNVLIYAYDLDAGGKRATASDLLRRLWSDGTGALSTQVMQEFYVNATTKIAKTVTPAKARAVISRYAVWKVVMITPDSVIRASELQERHRLSFWDAMIVTAASEAGAAILYTEDLNHGQSIEGVQVVNPFVGDVR
jgi:predicted nucleic acid-binding protein